MNIGLIIGFVLSFGGIVVGFLMEGGSPGAFLSISAFLIVFGGTFGAAMVSFPLPVVLNLPNLFREAIFDKPLDYGTYVRQIADMARKQRANGQRALQQEIDGITDPLLKQGVNMVVNTWDEKDIRKYLDTALESTERRHERGILLLEAMGGYSPTMGIIGTVLGLINVLANLNEPEELGAHIATAFIATLFGVGAANLVWLPVASNLKRKSELEKHLREMVVDGILMLRAEVEPRRLIDSLLAHLPPTQREAIKQEFRDKKAGDTS